jgi:valyl-tRNA synthetase
MMMGLHFMKKPDGSPQVPFDTVYIHALVRDEKGQKMSKSKGNVIDPLELIDQFGADACASPLPPWPRRGATSSSPPARVEGYRNFGTKLWNAARFAEMNGAVRVEGFDPAQAKVRLNRWIAGEAAKTRDAVTSAIDEHRYNEAAGALYSFIWHTFCDWYVELSKPILNGTDEAALAETRAMTAWTLDQILKLLHPFMPFITEELWQKTAGERGRDTMLVNAAWPVYEGLGDADAAAEMEWVIRLITEIRSVRSEMNVPAGAKIACVLAHPSDESAARAKRWEAEISRLARLDSLTTADAVPEGSAQIVMDEAVIALPLAGVIDFAAEKARLAKELDKTAKDIAAIEGRLNNPGFVAKAPPAVIEEAKERREELSQRVSQVKDALGRLEAMG